MYLRAHLLYLHFLAVSVQTDQGREMQSSTAVTPLLLFILRIDQLIEGGGKKFWSDIRLSC